LSGYKRGKIWLFWFCEGLACVSGKTKCAKCAEAKKLKNKKCAGAKNKTSLRLLVSLLIM